MQHPPELKTKFLELRAQGVSYGRIADAIGVSKPTLIQWGKAMAEDIADLQEAQRELIREKLIGNLEQWLGRQVHHFNRLDEELGRREFKYSPTESVFRMMMASRKLLDRYFFEDDRPRSRRTNGRAAAPPAPSEHANTSRSTPRPSPDSALESGSPDATVYSENPAKTQPFPGQNSGVDNPILSSPPLTLAQPDFGTLNGRAAAPPAVASESESSAHDVTTESETHSLDTTGKGSTAVPSPGGEGHDDGQTDNLMVPSARPCVETPNAESAANDRSQLTIENPPVDDFGGESVPIGPFESTREWLERQGIQVSKIPKGARIITAG